MANIDINLANGQKAGDTLKQLTNQAAALKKELMGLKPGTDEFVKASQSLNSVISKQKDLQDEIKSTVTASESLKAAWNKLPGAQYFNQVSESFKIMKGGVGGLISSFGVLKTAIIATGIGFLVVAVATLVGWLKKTDEGATLLSGVMKGLGIVMDTVFGKLIDGFKYLYEFFNGKKSIKQGLIDLVDFIGNNLLNRVKAFLVIWEGITSLDLKKTTDGFIQLTTGVENGTDKMLAFGQAVADAVNEGILLEKELDDIADAARDLGVMNAQTKKDVDQLLLQSKNVALSYEERIALLDKASKLELANHASQLENARRLERARAKEIEDNAKRNENSDELEQALADATTARIALENESINLQEKIANRRTALVEKETAEREKALEAERKIQDDIAALQVQAMEESSAKEIEKVKLDTELKIAALQGSEGQILIQKSLLAEIEGQTIQAIKDKYALQEQEAAAKKAAEDLKHAQEESDKKKKIAKEEADYKRALADAELEFVGGALQAGIDLMAADEKARKKNAQTIKAFTISQIIVDTVREISGYMATPGSIASLGAIGTLKAVGAIIRSGIAISKVNAQKFETGGPILGPRHSGGGVNINAEGGEFIFSRQAVRAIGMQNLDMLNRRYTFEAGGPVNPFDKVSNFNPGSSRNTTENAGNALIGFELLREAILVFAKATDERFDRIQVVNNLQETRDGINTINRITNEADV